MSIKQTEIGAIQSGKFYVKLFLPTVTVIVAHPVYKSVSKSKIHHLLNYVGRKKNP
jgi:hypothetical protein